MGKKERQKSKLLLCIVCALGFLVLSGCFPSSPAHATTGINQEVSFEGKIVNASGINIADGSYNVEFKIYAGGTATGGGTLDWTEDELVHNSQAVTFTSGTFQVNLGAVNSFGSSINWNTYPLYLSIQIGNTSNCTISTTFQSNCGGDGEMTPYILLTSTPYALNSGQLGGLTAAQFLQLAPGSAQVDSGATSSVFVNKTGASGNILELQKSGTDVASVSNTGALTLQNSSDSTAALNIIGHTSGLSVFDVDTTNGRVGIGTASPDSPLQIASNAPAGSDNAILHITGSITDASNYQSGLYAAPTIAPGSASLQEYIAAKASAISSSSNLTSATLTGLYGSVYWNGASGYTLQNAYGLHTQLFTATSGVILTNAIGALIQNPNTAGGGTITNDYGVNIENQTHGATINANLALGGTPSSGNYSIYSPSAYQSYFAGNIGIGNTNPSFKLDVTGTGNFSTSIQTPLLDTASAVALNLGTTNATGINLNQNTIIASNKSLTADGSALFKDATNSTTAFRVQNSSGTNLLTADTTNGNIVLGNDGTPAALTVRGGAATGSNAPGTNLTIDASNGTGTGGSGDLIFRTAPAAAAATVTQDSVGTAQAGNVSSLTWSHTIGTGSNRLLIVGVSSFNAGASSVKYGGTPLSLLTSFNGGGYLYSQIWYMTNPPSGTASVLVTLPSAQQVTADSVSYSNVNQTTTFGTVATNFSYAASGGPATNVVGGTNSTQLVFDNLSDSANGAGWATSSTLLWSKQTFNGGSASSKAGASGSTTVTWTGGASNDDWLDAAVPINPASSSGSAADTLADRLHITASGNVGIGDASPSNNLKVVGSLCVKNAAGACAGNTSGTIYATNTTVQSADLAENYVSSQTLQPGDVVMLAGDGDNQAIAKSTSSYQKQVIGIISTQPGVTLNSDAQTNAQHPYLYPVALNGRVPVRVSTINGPIESGDYLTASDIPGVAMKATRPGQMVGKALEDYTDSDPNTTGIVLAFVNLPWADPGQQAVTNNANDISLLTASNVAFKNASDSTVAFQIQSADGTPLLMADTKNMIVTVANLAVTGTLKINGHLITTGTAPSIVAGPAACTDGSVRIDGNDTFGTVIIVTGHACRSSGALATVNFSTAYGTIPKVTLTPGTAQSAGLMVYRTASVDNFAINSSVVPSDLTTYTFDYFVGQAATP